MIRRLKRRWRALRGELAAIPHLFAKAMVLHCVFWGTAASFYALRILSRTGHDATGLLAVILGFFGGELLLLCLKKVLAEPRDGGSGQGATSPDGAAKQGERTWNS